MGRSKRSKNKKDCIRKARRELDKEPSMSDIKKQEKSDKKKYKKEQKMVKKILIGLYDSFRKDGSLHSKFDATNSELIGSYSTEPIYSMYDLGINDDCVIKVDGHTSIKMEVWLVNEELLNRIERTYNYHPSVTGVSQLYSKEEVISPFGKINIYIYRDAYIVGTPLESGDWIDYQSYLKAIGGATKQYANGNTIADNIMAMNGRMEEYE